MTAATPEAELFTLGKRIRRPYTPSPEAIERRKARDIAYTNKRRENERAARLEAAKGTPAATARRMMAWRIGPVEPELSKPQLREMFAVAMRNTAAMSV